MLSSEEYRVLDEKALRLRLDYGLLEDRLDMDELARKTNVSLIPYSSLPEKAREFIKEKSEKLNDGFYVLRTSDTFPRIFYNDGVESDRRIRFTIAHEFKHFVFGDRDGDRDEEAANHFAPQLLIPTCLVMMYLLKGYDVCDLCSRFDVSLQVAEYAYIHAKNRTAWRANSLEDHEVEFMRDYFQMHYSIGFDGFKTKEEK